MKYGLDIPTVGKFADPHVLAEIALEAEQAGWDGFFLWDMLFSTDSSSPDVADSWIALSAIAMRTQTLKIGAFLTPLARRHPWQVARQAVTLDHLSRGRLIFGAGLGYQAEDFVSFGEDYDAKHRAERLDEGLTILNGLWTGEPFNFAGTHYQVSAPAFLPQPLQSPRIPIWTAGGWPNRKPLRRAAHWDGIYLMTRNQETNEYLKPAEVQEALAYIHSHRTSTTPFDVAINGVLPNDPTQHAQILQQYQDAGVTWWVAYQAQQSLDEYRQYIKQGPPKRLSK